METLLAATGSVFVDFTFLRSGTIELADASRLQGFFVRLPPTLGG